MIRLTPEQEEEVRLAWNCKTTDMLHTRFTKEQWSHVGPCDEPCMTHGNAANFRAAYIAAKGWDKEGEK